MGTRSRWSFGGSYSDNRVVLHSFPRVLNFENTGIDFYWLPRFTNKAIKLQLQCGHFVPNSPTHSPDRAHLALQPRPGVEEHIVLAVNLVFQSGPHGHSWFGIVGGDGSVEANPQSDSSGDCITSPCRIRTEKDETDQDGPTAVTEPLCFRIHF